MFYHADNMSIHYSIALSLSLSPCAENRLVPLPRPNSVHEISLIAEPRQHFTLKTIMLLPIKCSTLY